jgi:hypothetical protein
MPVKRSVGSVVGETSMEASYELIASNRFDEGLLKRVAQDFIQSAEGFLMISGANWVQRP